MTCRYCGSRNGEGEHRCRRCGRTPSDTLTGEFTLPRTDGALAAKLQPCRRTSIRRSHRCPGGFRTGRPEGSAPVQGSLFQERSASNVIPFDSFVPSAGAPPKPDPRPRAARSPRRSHRLAGLRACRRPKASWIFCRPFRPSRAPCAPRWKPSSAARRSRRFLSIAPWPPRSTGPWCSSGMACSWRRSGSAAALLC